MENSKSNGAGASAMTNSELAFAWNNHLTFGGVILITTMTRATLYDERHAGWFTVHDGRLCVRQGKKLVALSTRDGHVLVSVKLGTKVPKA